MIKGIPSYKKAFFDTADDVDLAFWNQANLDFFDKFTKTPEHAFFVRRYDVHPPWQNCTLFMAGSYLICKTKADGKVDYIDLEDSFYKAEVIKVSKKGDKNDLPGFSLQKNGIQAEFLCKKSYLFGHWLDVLANYCVMTNFNDKFKILSILGSGGYGKVFLLEDTTSKQTRAGKFIKMDPPKSREKQQMMVMNEVTSLRKLNHPNIVKLYEVHELDNDIVIVMEHVTGERLFDAIVRAKGLNESDVAVIMKQLFSVLSYLQYKDIIHRDFKPENILLTGKKNSGEYKIKLIDFGLAQFYSKKEKQRKGGTAGYVAPEVLNNEHYNFKADLYSVGVIMYTSLTGKPLFSAINYQDLLNKNKKGIPRFNGTGWAKITPRGKDLLQKILEASPKQRCSLEEAIEHPWLKTYLSTQERDELLQSTLQFVHMDVPKESAVSEIPSSRGFIPNMQKISSLNNFETANSMHSVAAFPSYFFSHSKDNNLNSFYKLVSRDSDGGSSSQDPDGGTSENKSHVLGLPRIRGSSVSQKPPSQLSLSSLNNKDYESLRFGGYNIQINGITPQTSFELDHVPSEDEIPCSVQYKKLEPIPLFFKAHKRKQRASVMVSYGSEKKSLPSRKSQSLNKLPTGAN